MPRGKPANSGEKKARRIQIAGHSSLTSSLIRLTEHQILLAERCSPIHQFGKARDFLVPLKIVTHLPGDLADGVQVGALHPGPLAEHIGKLLFPEFDLPVSMVTGWGELVLMIWLLIWGGKSRSPA